MATIQTTVISPVNVEERRMLDVRSGDTVRVHQKIQEKGKTRIQVFEGTVLARKHGSEPGATFTVRRVSGGYGVEKVFPLYSPMIDKIEIVKRARVRRSKLYYIREKATREIKRQMRRLTMMDVSTEGEAERLAREEAEAKAQAEREAAEQAQAAQNIDEQPDNAPIETGASEAEGDKGNKEFGGKDVEPETTTPLEEAAEDASVEEVKDIVNTDTPETSEEK